MHVPTLWKSALVQGIPLAIVFAVLGLTLDKSFFESWGWLIGPAAWLGMAAVTAKVLDLPRASTLIGATLTGLVSVVFIVLHRHDVGSVVALVLFALWCARLHDDPDLVQETI